MSATKRAEEISATKRAVTVDITPPTKRADVMDEATGQHEAGIYEWDIELTPEQRAIIEEGWLRNGTDDQHGERKGTSLLAVYHPV